MSLMRKQKLLFFDDDPYMRETAQRILLSTTASCLFPDNIDQLVEMIENNKFSLIILNFVTHQEMVKRKVDLKNENVVILAKEKLKTIHSYMMQLPTFSNFIAKDAEGQFLGRELLTTVCKLLSNDIFGVKKYLNWGASNMIYHVRDSYYKQDYINVVTDYCDRLNLRKPIVNYVTILCDELLMNALYDAPRNDEGEEKFSSLPRTERIMLKPSESARLELACDGDHLAVSVSDPFGGLSRKIVMDYLSRCFKPYGSKLGPNEKGGAGLGIYMSFNAVNKFIINVDPHIRTELIGIIDLNLSVKEFKYLNKSFHFFTKNTLARQFCLHNPMRDDF